MLSGSLVRGRRSGYEQVPSIMRIIDSAKKTYELAKRNKAPKPEGEAGLKLRGYKNMVGGRWDEIGQLQFEYMRKQGLRPDHIFCDVACGSFRAGRFFIDYLLPGYYLGIDKQHVLVESGRREVIGEEIWQEKCPEIVISNSFEFSKFSKRPQMAIANSLFTHLKAADIKKCLRKLYDHASPGCVFYATFFETDAPVWHVYGSHSSRKFMYTRSEMHRYGETAGWQSEYIGDWNHPRKQMMMRYIKPVVTS